MSGFNQNIRIGDRMIGPDYPTYIIAEIGGNFDGSLEKAKRLIEAAKEAGADCAKFQTFKAESIVSEGGFSKMQLHGVHGSWGRTVSEVFKDVELPLEWHRELAEHCRKVGIDFSTSPYNKEAVDLCADMKLPFIKIGSGEITWLEMLDYIARKGMPVMLATGDATMSEIDEAVRTIEKTGNKDFVLMQCITNYPSKLESANVNVLKTYQSAFGCLTGYSDHAPGPVVAIASVVLGGRVIEKHFTLDKTLPGNDHYHAGDPEDFAKAIANFRWIDQVLGSPEKTVLPCEMVPRHEARRSLVLTRDMKAGEVIAKEDLMPKRPGTGISPVYTDIVIGRPVKTDLPEDTILTWDMI